MRSLDRGESLAVISLILILVGLPAAVLGYQFVLRPARADVRTIDVLAAAPEAGGFQPDTIRVAAGEKVRLRFSVPDVTHGIAIGPGLDLDLGHVDPGDVKEIEVAFEKPGRYTFYCNSWCSPNHWRMRGTIEVYDPKHPEALNVTDAGDPVTDSLLAQGVDIDRPHEAMQVPAEPPSAAQGATVVERLDAVLPPEMANPDWIRSHSPSDAWGVLIETGLDADEAWDVVAFLWLAQVGATRLESAATLYAKNCAACHGEYGDGKGPGADALAAQGLLQHRVAGTTAELIAFVDPRTMLGGTSQLYYAKIRRGGMGTGMPAFGALLTRDETWALVDFLWTFVFDE